MTELSKAESSAPESTATTMSTIPVVESMKEEHLSEEKSTAKKHHCKCTPATDSVKPKEEIGGAKPQSVPASEAIIPHGYRLTKFPCFPCHRDGVECWVPRWQGLEPCNNKECKGKIGCCADQRISKRSLGKSNLDEDDFTLVYREYISILQRREEAMLEYAHRDKVKVGGRWTQEDWTPIDPSAPMAWTKQTYLEALCLFDGEMEADIRALKSFLFKVEEDKRAELVKEQDSMRLALNEVIQGHEQDHLLFSGKLTPLDDEHWEVLDDRMRVLGESVLELRGRKGQVEKVQSELKCLFLCRIVLDKIVGKT